MIKEVNSQHDLSKAMEIYLEAFPPGGAFPRGEATKSLPE